jgi:hypothetical protein
MQDTAARRFRFTRFTQRTRRNLTAPGVAQVGPALLGRSPFLHPEPGHLHPAVTGARIRLGAVADVLAFLGIVAFVLAMLGLIWALERV